MGEIELRQTKCGGRFASMALDRTFAALTPDSLKALIMGARRRVIYAAPSLSLPVATALINAHERLGSAVAVVIDASESVLRLGYGVADALGLLRDKQVPIRHEAGLRIAFVVADEDGYIFALAPLLVEENSNLSAHPNAVMASRSQLERLVEAVTLPRPSESPSLLPQTTAATRQEVEIGQTIISPREVEKIEQAISTNPVENFDLTRVVHVFSTYFQFFELEVIGTYVERRTVQLPKELLGSIRDKTMRDRITSAFKMISSESKVSSAAVQKQSAEIRRRFIRHHPIHGGVMLKSDLTALNAEIAKLRDAVDAHKETVLNRHDRDIQKSIESLVLAFWRDIGRNPPQELLDQGIAKPTTEQAKDYLRDKLVEAFPTAQILAGGMRVTTVVKDITWNTLNDKAFVDWLRAQWPQRVDIKKPFDEYRAARERLSHPRPTLR